MTMPGAALHAAQSACMALCLASTPVGASETLPRFRCALDGVASRLVAVDLSRHYPETAWQCERLEAIARASEPPPAATSTETRLTVITAARPGVNTQPWRALPDELGRQIRTAAERQRLDPRLVTALIYVESRYRSDARSPKGALGLMQVMPDTARRYGVTTAEQLLDPMVNLDVGTRHLRDLHSLYGTRIDLVLAAYNAGQGAVSRHGNKVPPYPETEAYVDSIASLLRH